MKKNRRTNTHTHTHTHTERERERVRERDTYRQRERWTDRQTDSTCSVLLKLLFTWILTAKYDCTTR